MCGWHRERSDGAPLRVALFGAIFFQAMPLLWGGAELWAEDEDDETSDEGPGDSSEEGTDQPSEAPKTVSTSIEVLGRALSTDARRRPESAFTVPIDESVEPTASVADVLLRVPGATVRRTGGPLDPSFVSIRGASSRQTAVFVDGVPLNNFGASVVDLSELALGAFDRIEVYRGYSPSHLGGFAIGGAVDLVSDPYRTPPPRLEVSYGSWQTRRVALSAAAPIPVAGGSGHVRAHVTYQGTAGSFPSFSNNGTLYDDTDDVTLPRGNNQRDQLTGWLSMSANAGRVEFRLLDLPTWSDGGEPGAYYAQSKEARSRVVQNLLHGRVRILAAPGVQIAAGVGWRVRSDLYQDLLGEVGVGNQDQRNQVHSIDIDVSGRFDPLVWLQLRPSARVHILLHRGTDHLPTTTRGPWHRRAGGQFAVDGRLLPAGDTLEIRGSLGALILDTRTEGEASSDLLVDVLPGVAVAARPVPWMTLRGSVARAVRAPTFVELYGDRGSIVGNPSLRPERATQADGGIGLEFDQHPDVVGSVEVGGYLRDTRDLIVLVPNSARVGVPQNIGRALVGGVETHGELRAGPFEGRVALTANLGSRILEGESGTVGNRVPHVPLWQVSASLAAVLGSFVRLQWSFVGLGGTFDSPSNFFEQSTRPLHDLHLRVQPHRVSPWVALDVRNLFNTFVGTSYRNPLRPSVDDVAPVALQDFRGQPLPGRSLMVTLGWTPGARQ